MGAPTSEMESSLLPRKGDSKKARKTARDISQDKSFRVLKKKVHIVQYSIKERYRSMCYGDTSLHFLILGTKWRCRGQLHTLINSCGKGLKLPLDLRLGWSQSWSGCCNEENAGQSSPQPVSLLTEVSGRCLQC
jgi:hypothetical protein